MESVEDIVIFARVVEKGSFTAAAKELKKSTSAVSKHVRRLEESLALKLLHRSTHHLALTDPGAIYYEHCSRIIAELEEARANVTALTGDVGGVLRVHSSPGVGQSLVSPAIIDFAMTYRSASIELSISEITANVIKRGVDVMVCSRDFGRDNLFHSSLLSRDIGPTPYVICGSPRYFEQHGFPGTPEDLQKHNCLIHVTQKPNPDEWQFLRGSRVCTVRVSGSFHSNLEKAVLLAATEGLGIARLPAYSVGGMLASGALKAIFSGEVHSNRIIRAFYPRSKYEPCKTRVFLECVERRYKQTLAGD
jgi:DNA-binding transcriptional LysR family regulator